MSTGEYLHNLMVTSSWIWAVLSLVGAMFFAAVTDDNRGKDKLKAFGVMILFFISWVLNAVFLYTYYN